MDAPLGLYASTSSQAFCVLIVVSLNFNKWRFHMELIEDFDYIGVLDRLSVVLSKLARQPEMSDRRRERYHNLSQKQILFMQEHLG